MEFTLHTHKLNSTSVCFCMVEIGWPLGRFRKCDLWEIQHHFLLGKKIPVGESKSLARVLCHFLLVFCVVLQFFFFQNGLLKDGGENRNQRNVFNKEHICESRPVKVPFKFCSEQYAESYPTEIGSDTQLSAQTGPNLSHPHVPKPAQLYLTQSGHCKWTKHHQLCSHLQTSKMRFVFNSWMFFFSMLNWNVNSLKSHKEKDIGPHFILIFRNGFHPEGAAIHIGWAICGTRHCKLSSAHYVYLKLRSGSVTSCN